MHAVGAEFFHAGGWTDGQMDTQTDMTKLIVAFHNFANMPITVFRMFLIFSSMCNEYVFVNCNAKS